MKKVEVKEQVRLPLRRCVELVLSGVKFRIFRAAITVAIISLAVAFLMTMLCESLIARKVADVVSQRTAPRQKLLFWVGRLSVPLTESQLTDQLADLKSYTERQQEYKTFSGLSEQKLAWLSELARSQKRYMRFFDSLAEGKKSVLVGRARGTEILDQLSEERNFEDFQVKLQQSDRQLPGSLEQFRQFLADRRAAHKPRQKIRQGHQDALDALRTDFLKGRSPKQVLAGADESVRLALRKHGFRLSEQDVSVVREQAALALDMDRIARLLSISRVKQRLANRRNISKVAKISSQTLLAELSSLKGARWFAELLDDLKRDIRRIELQKQKGQDLKPEEENLLVSKKLIEQFNLPAERIRKVARERLFESKLADVEAVVAEDAGAGRWMGFSDRTIWLLAVSFIVCIVGIANAMLMSVTERFREIATMKCLGATNGFIMTNFILESIAQGIVGGVIGVFLGFGLGAVRSWVKYGWMAVENLPALEGLQGAAFSLTVGVIISALAAVYPAWVAARLAPMEAMRIE